MQYISANLIGFSSGATHAPSQPDCWYNLWLYSLDVVLIMH